MIRSEELIDKLIADLHFHNYLEMTGSDIMNQKRNVVASKDKIDVIQSYVDDVFIDFFFRSQSFKPIIIPQSFYNKRYTKDGVKPDNTNVELNLNNVYDRYTFVHLINLLFSRSWPLVREISPNNHFLSAFIMKERIFAPYCRCFTPIMEMPYHDVLEQYLDFIYGTRHSLFVPQFRAEAVKKYGLYFQENWLKFTMGKTNYAMDVLHNRYKDYISIKDSHIFGEYTLENILFLYSILAEKMNLQDDNLLSFISLYCESFDKSDNIVNMFDKFEKEHNDYHEIEPFITINDLYLRLTSTERSKAFKFTPINHEVMEIQQFQFKAIRTIYCDNTLPLPYFYNLPKN